MVLLLKITLVALVVCVCRADCGDPAAPNCIDFETSQNFWTNVEEIGELSMREDCTFDADNCTITPHTTAVIGEILWKRGSGDTTPAIFSFDHKYGSSSGGYMYANGADGAVAGSNSLLISGTLSGLYCFTFFYYASGNDIGVLTVAVEESSGGSITVVSIYPEPTDKDRWIETTVKVDPYMNSTNYRVFFLASFNGPNAIWGLDDISFTVGSCRECYTNKTLDPNLEGPVIVRNPDPDIFKHALTWDEETKVICDTTFSDDFKWINISGNCKIRNIIIAFHNETDGLSTIIGGDVTVMHAYEVCQVKLTGETFTVEAQFRIREHPNINEGRLQIDSKLAMRNNSAEGPETIFGFLNYPLVWTLDIPANYNGLLESCSVFPGTTTDSTSREKSLVSSGCSQEGDMVGDFEMSTFVVVGDVKRYYTDFYPFKYLDSDFITIHCRVRICTVQSGSCDFTCSSSGKRSVDLRSDKGDHVLDSAVTIKVTDELISQFSSASSFSLKASLLTFFLVTALGQV